MNDRAHEREPNKSKATLFFFFSLSVPFEGKEWTINPPIGTHLHTFIMDEAKDAFLGLLATLEGDELLSFETFVGAAIGI